MRCVRGAGYGVVISRVEDGGIDFTYRARYLWLSLRSPRYFARKPIRRSSRISFGHNVIDEYISYLHPRFL